jgi:hypothetical protein
MRRNFAIGRKARSSRTRRSTAARRSGRCSGPIGPHATAAAFRQARKGQESPDSSPTQCRGRSSRRIARRTVAAAATPGRSWVARAESSSWPQRADDGHVTHGRFAHSLAASHWTAVNRLRHHTHRRRSAVLQNAGCSVARHIERREFVHSTCRVTPDPRPSFCQDAGLGSLQSRTQSCHALE